MQKTHLSYIAETCSTAQLLADNAVPPTMQNTHYRRDRVICTELPVLSHTLSHILIQLVRSL